MSATRAEHAGAAPPEHAEHFDSLAQQNHASRLGMWVFLGSETLLFAALFGVFAGYRTAFPEAFVAGVHHNNALIGTANTAILLTSSLTAALAVLAIRFGFRRLSAAGLGVTVLLGGVFLALKFLEYSDHFEHGIYPAGNYTFQELPLPGGRLFFTMYYFLTGLHAAHVIGGMSFLAWLTVQTLRRRYTASKHNAVENGVLYWHLVDVIWIFLWPLLYLES